MTCEELKQAHKRLEEEISDLYSKMAELTSCYIKEHQPADIKPNTHIRVKMRVTEEGFSRLDNSKKCRKKYSIGNTYFVIGFFLNWRVNKHGVVYPDLWGKDYVNGLDELISVEITKSQLPGECSKCRNFEKGYCYLTGGKDCKSLARKVEPNDIVCPKYEEVIPAGLYENGEANRHCPNATKVYDINGSYKYRVYSLNWEYYTEHTAGDAWGYSTSPVTKEV